MALISAYYQQGSLWYSMGATELPALPLAVQLVLCLQDTAMDVFGCKAVFAVCKGLPMVNLEVGPPSVLVINLAFGR